MGEVTCGAPRRRGALSMMRKAFGGMLRFRCRPCKHEFNRSSPLFWKLVNSDECPACRAQLRCYRLAPGQWGAKGRPRERGRHEWGTLIRESWCPTSAINSAEKSHRQFRCRQLLFFKKSFARHTTGRLRTLLSRPSCLGYLPIIFSSDVISQPAASAEIDPKLDPA